MLGRHHVEPKLILFKLITTVPHEKLKNPAPKPQNVFKPWVIFMHNWEQHTLKLHVFAYIVVILS